MMLDLPLPNTTFIPAYHNIMFNGINLRATQGDSCQCNNILINGAVSHISWLCGMQVLWKEWVHVSYRVVGIDASICLQLKLCTTHHYCVWHRQIKLTALCGSHYLTCVCHPGMIHPAQHKDSYHPYPC